MSIEFQDQAIFMAPLDRVQALLGNPGFALQKYRRLGHQNVTVIGLINESDYFEIVCSYRVDQSPEMPAFFKKILMSSFRTTSVRHTYSLIRSERRGYIKIGIEQISSISIGCEFILRAQNNMTVIDMNWRVCCSLPLVGPSVERFVCNDIRQKSPEDTHITMEMLQEQVVYT